MPLFTDADFNALLKKPELKRKIEARRALKNQNIRNLMKGEDPVISFTNLLEMTPLRRIILENKVISDLLRQNQLSLHDAWHIRNQEMLRIVTKPEVLALVLENHVFSMTELMHLKPIGTLAIAKPGIRALLTAPNPLITKTLLDKFSATAQYAFIDPGIMEAFSQKKISLSKLLKIRPSTYTVLANPFARRLFLEEPSCLSKTQKALLFEIQESVADILVNAGARQCIAEFNPADPLITLHDVFLLNGYASQLFCQEGIRRLLRHGILTLRDLQQMDYTRGEALEDPETIHRLIQGQLTLNQIFTNPRRYRNQFINGAQSTHSASVHRTTAQTISQLHLEYGKEILSIGVPRLIQQITTWVDELPLLPESILEQKKKAAQNYLQRLEGLRKTHLQPVEAITKINLDTFIALSWFAIHDHSKRIGTIEDALQSLLEAFYEIQRGYNLDEKGIDDKSGRDNYICGAGSFNKLCEKLLGHHPSFHLVVITREGASAKLPRVVRTVIESYLLDKTTEHFEETIERLSKEGPSAIWDTIQPSILNEIYEEFGDAFQGCRNNSALLELVSYGVDTELTEEWLKKLREKYNTAKSHLTKVEQENVKIENESNNEPQFNWETLFFEINNEPRFNCDPELFDIKLEDHQYNDIADFVKIEEAQDTHCYNAQDRINNRIKKTAYESNPFAFFQEEKPVNIKRNHETLVSNQSDSGENIKQEDVDTVCKKQKI